MKCPHCRIEFHDDPFQEEEIELDENIDENWKLEYQNCPSCKKLIIYLINFENTEHHFTEDPNYTGEPTIIERELSRMLIYPKGSSRSPCPIEVPKEFAEDYAEACIVIQDSPKASAALSRRCLQNLLRNVAGVRPQDLFHEIQEVIDSGKLPSHLVECIDAIRNVGNFAAHPLKSQKTGEIFAVEPHEAEWNLDVLEELFDFYFVQPGVIKRKREALNKKLKDAGKNPMI